MDMMIYTRYFAIAIFLMGSVLSEQDNLDVLNPQPSKRLSEPKRPTIAPTVPPESHVRRFSLWEFDDSLDSLTNGNTKKRLSQPGPTKYPPTGSPGSQNWQYPSFGEYLPGNNFTIDSLNKRLSQPGLLQYMFIDPSGSLNRKRLSQPGPTKYPPTGSPWSQNRRFLFWNTDEASDQMVDNSNRKRLSQPGPTKYPPTGSPGSQNRRFLFWNTDEASDQMVDNSNHKRLSQPGPTKYPPTGSPGSQNRRFLFWNTDEVSDQMVDNSNHKRLSQPGPTKYPPTGSPRTNGSPAGPPGSPHYKQGPSSWHSLPNPLNGEKKSLDLEKYKMAVDNKRNVFSELWRYPPLGKNKRTSPPGPTLYPYNLPPFSDLKGVIMSNLQGEDPNFDINEYLSNKKKSTNLCNDLGSVVIESSGQWDNGGATIEASFPSPAEFSWLLGYAVSKAHYTRGKYNTVAGITSTVVTLDYFDLEVYEISLTLKFPSGGVYLRLDNEVLREKGKMYVKCPGPLFENDSTEIQIPETGDAVLNLPLFSEISDNLDVFYTFLNTSSEPYTIGGDILFSTLSPEDFEVEYKTSIEKREQIQLTLDSTARLYGGTINVHLSMLEVNDESSPPFVKFANVHQSFNIVRPSTTAPLTAGVAFGSWEQELDTRVIPNCVSYRSITCSAVGSPSPNLRLYKDGVQLNTFSLGENGASRRVFYPLDGKAIGEIIGWYTCKASSGNMTITRDILAVPVNF